MITAATCQLYANRFTPWSFNIVIEGVDLSGAAVLMHVRQLPDAGGTPLLALNSGVGGEITVSYSAPDTTIAILVPEVDMKALPTPAETGMDLDLHYDIQITPSGGIKEVYFRGTFTVLAGVTQ